MVHAQLLVKALVSSCLVGAASCFVVVTPRGVAPQRRCPSCFPSPLPPCQRGMGSRLRAKKKKSNSGRPSLDDVERLSRGQAAKKRGTGSRGVCHRLNESERKVRCTPHVHHVAVVFWFPSQFASPRCMCVSDSVLSPLMKAWHGVGTLQHCCSTMRKTSLVSNSLNQTARLTYPLVQLLL